MIYRLGTPSRYVPYILEVEFPTSLGAPFVARPKGTKHNLT